MADKDEAKETCICEGRIDGVFTGFRNHDTIFKIQGAGSWRQDEYLYRYHHLFSPKARVMKIVDEENHKEIFYLEVDGVKARVQVKYAYV